MGALHVGAAGRHVEPGSAGALGPLLLLVGTLSTELLGKRSKDGPFNAQTATRRVFLC